MTTEDTCSILSAKHMEIGRKTPAGNSGLTRKDSLADIVTSLKPTIEGDPMQTHARDTVKRVMSATEPSGLGKKGSMLVQGNWPTDALYGVCRIVHTKDARGEAIQKYQEFFFSSKNEMRDFFNSKDEMQKRQFLEPVTQPATIEFETYQWDLGPQRTYK